MLPAEGSLRVFNGTYSEYKQALNGQIPFSGIQATPTAAPGPAPTRARPAEAAAPRTLSKDQLRRRQLKLEALEKQITEMEAHLRLVESQLQTPGNDPARIQRLGQEYNDLQQTLEGLMETWAELAED